MEKKKIIFRADGNAQIGLGHVMRCIALGQMISGDFELYFAIQNPSSSIQELLEADKFTVIDLPQTTGYSIDAENFAKFLTGSEIVVLDGYNFKESYQRVIKKASRKLIFIDDLAEWHQVADVVINHSGGIQVSDYQAESYTRFLLGTQYALLRKEFLNRDNRSNRNHSVTSPFKHLLINLGGSDQENITLKIIKILLEFNPSLKITAVLGGANQHLRSFEKLIGKVIVLSNLTAQEMVKQILDTDLVICSCSTISYEVAMLNRPFVGILTVENQRPHKVFFKKNIALDVLEKDFGKEELLSILKLSSKKMSQSLIKQYRFFNPNVGEKMRVVFASL